MTTADAPSSTSPAPAGHAGPERLLILPPTDQRTGTPYAEAHAGPARAARKAGGVVVANGPRQDGDDGSATALVLVRPIPVEQVQTALAAHRGITWVQLPFAGIEPYVPLIRSRTDITWTSAKGTYAPPVAEHALMLTLALLRDLPTRIRATRWGTAGGNTLNGMGCVIVGGGGIAREYLRLLKA